MKIRSCCLDIIFVCGLLVLACGTIGCDAFVRKFTRKIKKENMPKEEMVLAPVEYTAPEMAKEELYRQYFLYWKSWQDELIESLSREINHKKQLTCADEVIKNLEQLKNMLEEKAQNKIGVFISQFRDLKEKIVSDIYGTNAASLRSDAERIKRGILRDFSYNKIKGSLR